jgi:hypothetical protein
MSGMLIVSIHTLILSDGTRNVVTIRFAYERKGQARLATKLCFGTVAVCSGLFGVWIGRFNALEPRLPLRRWQSAK